MYDLLEFFLNFRKYLEAFLKGLFNIVKSLPLAAKYFTLGVTIFCFILECIRNPQGAINSFMCHAIDIVADVFPSTPHQYQIASILADFGASWSVIGWGILWQTLEGCLGLLSIYLVVKLYRMLPFI